MLGVSSQSTKTLILQIYKINNMNSKKILQIMLTKKSPLPVAMGMDSVL